MIRRALALVFSALLALTCPLESYAQTITTRGAASASGYGFGTKSNGGAVVLTYVNNNNFLDSATTTWSTTINSGSVAGDLVAIVTSEAPAVWASGGDGAWTLVGGTSGPYVIYKNVTANDIAAGAIVFNQASAGTWQELAYRGGSGFNLVTATTWSGSAATVTGPVTGATMLSVVKRTGAGIGISSPGGGWVISVFNNNGNGIGGGHNLSTFSGSVSWPVAASSGNIILLSAK